MEELSTQYERNGYKYVPLVTEESHLYCSIKILLLRPDPPGCLIRSGDIDNRLKTIFDSLRMPTSKAELGGHEIATEDEKPFFCLLEDDRLVTNIEVGD